MSTSPEKLQKKIKRLKRKLVTLQTQHDRQMDEQRQKEQDRAQVFLKTLNVIWDMNPNDTQTQDLYQEYFNKH